MTHLDAQIEAILFAIAEPITVRKLAILIEVSKEAVEEAVALLKQRLDEPTSGLRLIVAGEKIELVTSPEVSDVVKRALKQEVIGELTKPSLEALTILAYRGPMTRAELEQIRGVQSTMILRNLMTRGLVEVTEDKIFDQPLYTVSVELLKHLGVTSQKELPDFETLSQHVAIQDVLADLEPQKKQEASENT